VTPLALLAVVATASTVHAEPAPVLAARSRSPVEVFSTQPLALVGFGVSAGYERQLTDRTSAVVLGGFRAPALEDFSSRTFTLGAELRLWLRRASALRGPYVAVHASAGYTRLSDEMGYIGSSTGLTQRIDIGWRWVIRDRVSIAPSIGLGWREDIAGSGQLATTARGMGAIGLELGWVRWR